MNSGSELGITHSPQETWKQQAMICFVGSVFKFKNTKNFKEHMWFFPLLLFTIPYQSTQGSVYTFSLPAGTLQPDRTFPFHRDSSPR